MDKEIDNFDARNHTQAVVKIIARTAAFTIITVSALVAWRCDGGVAGLELERDSYKEELKACIAGAESLRDDVSYYKAEHSQCQNRLFTCEFDLAMAGGPLK